MISHDLNAHTCVHLDDLCALSGAYTVVFLVCSFVYSVLVMIDHGARRQNTVHRLAARPSLIVLTLIKPMYASNSILAQT